MKKLLIAGLCAFLMVASFSMAPPSSAQMVVIGAPYLGPMSPWFWFNHNWYYNGVMYGYYGPGYEWAPYGSVTNVVVQQPAHYYNNPQWDSWANRHPEYGQHWQHEYHGGMRNENYHPTANSTRPPWHDQKGVAGQEHRPGTDPHTPVAGAGNHGSGNPIAGPGNHGPGNPIAGPANSTSATGFHGNAMTPARTPIAGPTHSIQAQQTMAHQAQNGGQPGGQPGMSGHPGGNSCSAPHVNKPAPAKNTSSSSSSSSSSKKKSN